MSSMNGHMEAEVDREWMDNALLDTRTNTSLPCPDLDAMRSDRRNRTRAAMRALNPGLTKTVLPLAENLSRQERAAICIQAHVRGHLARKQYVQLLYQHYHKEDEWRAARAQRQVEDGELLIENHRLEVEFEENHCIRRNRIQRFTTHVITIQRAWRHYQRRKLATPRQPDAGYHSNPVSGGDRGGGCGGGRGGGGGGGPEEGRDANGNRTAGTEEGHRILRHSQPDDQPETDNADSQPRTHPHWFSTDSDIPADSGDMTAARRSKAQRAMLQELGSSVELDDNRPQQHAYESSPDISSDGDNGAGAGGNKKKNRLSLAEEFAAAMEEDLGLLDGQEDSDLDESDSDEEEEEEEEEEDSSCATTPEWDTPRQQRPTPELILTMPETTPASEAEQERWRRLEQGGADPTSRPGAVREAPDPNENFSPGAESDPNANDLVALAHPQCGAETDAPREGGAQRTVASLTRTAAAGGGRAVTHSRIQRCLSAEARSGPLTGSTVTATVTPAQLGPRGRAQTDLAGLEPTMPVLDWESLEKHLAKMEKEEEQQSYKQTQKNSRQAILRKLAMGTDDEAEGDIYGKSKDKLSTRLQSGMNLQVCFVNEPADGSDLEEDSPRILAAEPGAAGGREESHVTSRFGRVIGAGRLTSGGSSNPRLRLSRESSNTSSTSTKTPSVTFQDAEDFETQQARLQDEARVALARAEPLARMQMELERQQRKKSPVTELAGVSGMTDLCDRLYGKKLTQRALRNMSISKLQFVVNDLHSQIESLNEELVKLLIRRDELQMEQDSKLIDIEDLTRWIRMNMQQNNNNNTIMGKQPLENGRKRQYETLLKLLGSTLPVSRKCFCGLSRSSSVVSSRSASSPEIQEMVSSPLSPQASICRSASSMSINESRASSPEMTWVRQAMIKYWYN